MQLEMSFKNMESNDRIKTFIEDKSGRLKKYFKGRIHVKWTVSHEREVHLAHLHVLGNHMDYFSDSEGESLLSCVESALHKLETQLKRKKERVKEHRNR